MNIRVHEPKVQRSKADLRVSFLEQVGLLSAYCEYFDAGNRSFAKPIANALRLLLHQSRNCTSLLNQVGLRNGLYFTVASALNPKNLASECDLIFLRATAAGATYEPKLEPLPGHKNRMPFPEWWSRSIAKGRKGQTLSRMDMVLSVADTDGGTHLDPSLRQLYADFRTGDFLGWYFNTSADSDGALVTSPEYACMRAVAGELLQTLRKYAPWSLPQA